MVHRICRKPGRLVSALWFGFTLPLAEVAVAADTPAAKPGSIVPLSSVQRALLPVPKRRMRGVQLEQQLFRASDGSVYQLLRAVPEAVPIDADAFVITQLAASANGLASCSRTTRSNGIAAFVGADPHIPQVLYPDAGIRRSAVFTPTDVSLVEFDPTNAGMLTVGRGVRAARLCSNPAECPVDTRLPLTPIMSPTDDGFSACNVPDLMSDCRIGGGPVSSYGFRQGAGVSTACEQAPTAAASICSDPPDAGLVLEAGQAVAFVYDAGLESHDFTVGTAAFAIDRSDTNLAGCPSDTVVSGSVLVDTAPSLP